MPEPSEKGGVMPDPIHRYNEHDLQRQLLEILQHVSGVEPERIQSEARLIEDLGIDSLGFYEILIEADEHLGIRIPEEVLLQFRTVADIQQHLRRLQQADA